MNKLKLLLLALLCQLALGAQAQIVITEIMYNPPESGADSLEFIEIYNNGNSTIDLTGWRLEYGASSFTLPALNIGPNQYRLFGPNAAALQNNFGVASTQWASGALGNNGATVKISNASNTLVDEVTYDDVAPWPVDADGFGASIVLCDPNADNSQPINWQAASTATGVTIAGVAVLANPGADAGCQGGNSITASNDFFDVEQGSTAGLNVLANDLLPNPVTGVFIITPPTQGSATVAPDNSIGYTAPANNCGSTSFTYSVCDANGCDTATVSIDLICYPAYTIAQVTNETATGAADSAGVSCQLTGVVYGVNLRPVNAGNPSLLFTIIDGFGNGIAVSSLNGTLGYTVAEGDLIQVRGEIGQFSGLTEIRPASISKIGTQALLSPSTVLEPSEATESKFIRINNLRLVNDAQWTTGMGASGFNVQAVSDDSPLDTVLIRIDRDVETYNAPVPPQPFELRGLGGQFDSSTPFDAGYQVLPRYNADISTLVNIREIDFSAQVTLAPNPATERLSIRSDIAFERIFLIAPTGQRLLALEQPAQYSEIAVKHLPIGTYFLYFQNAEGFWVTKFVKQ